MTTRPPGDLAPPHQDDAERRVRHPHADRGSDGVERGSLGWVLEVCAGGLLGSLLLGGCLGLPLGAMIGQAVGEWFDPGSSARPHAFEEPPAMLGALVGVVVSFIAGAILTGAVLRRGFLAAIPSKIPRSDFDDLE